MSAAGERLRLSLVPRVGFAYLRLLRLTMRLEFLQDEVLARIRREGGRYILAFWHSRFVMMRHGYPGQRMVVMISEHRDARLLGEILTRYGLVNAWGSSTRGGAGALRTVLRKIKEGHDVAVTPDGPRGPRRRAKPGVVAAARLSGVPIVPVGFSARPARRLHSWDRTVIPYPFSHGLYVYGEALRVARDADAAEQERVRTFLEAELDRLTDLADEKLGLPVEAARPPLEPGWDAPRVS